MHDPLWDYAANLKGDEAKFDYAVKLENYRGYPRLSVRSVAGSEGERRRLCPAFGGELSGRRVAEWAAVGTTQTALKWHPAN